MSERDILPTEVERGGQIAARVPGAEPGKVMAGDLRTEEPRHRASAATVNRRFKVVVCGDCKCQVRMLPDEGWQCSCCGVISEDDAHEIVVTAAVPLALIEAATS